MVLGMPSGSEDMSGECMITKREQELIAILLGSDSWMKGSVLAGMLGCGSRTLQAEIAVVNKMLSKHSRTMKIASNNRLGYRLEGSREQIKRIAAEQNAAPLPDSYESANAILTVLLYEKDYITLNRIADKTFLAPSSVSANMDKVRKMTERTVGAVLEVHPRRGYLLKASEPVRRMLAVNALGEEITEVSKQYPEIIESYELLPDIRRILIDVLVPESWIIEGRAFESFARYCAFSLTRQENGFPLQEDGISREIMPVIRRVAESLNEAFGHAMTDTGIYCLQERFEELNMIGTAKKNYPETEAKITRFFELVEAETGLVFAPKEDYRKRFSEHLYRMERRLNVGNYLRIPDPETFEKQYPTALHLVRTCLREVFGRQIPGNEERLMVSYIASLIDDSNIPVRVNIVSDRPVGEVYRFRRRMYESLGSMIDQIHIFPVYLYETRFAGREPDAVTLTTEAELTFRYSELMYIDLYAEEWQTGHIANVIKQRSEELRQRILRGYAEQFKNEVYEYKGKKADAMEILRQYAVLPDAVSESLIDAATLLVISHGTEQHDQKRIRTSGRALYKGKPVEQILYFRMGREPGAGRFPEYIREVVNRRI